MSAVESLSGADRAWLLMDRPTNPMVVVGLIVLRRPLALARLTTLIAERFLAFERFRRIPVADATNATWTEAAQLDLADHVLRVSLPRGATQRDLEALVGELASTPFKPGLPLWSFHLVEHYRGGSAFIVRIHHCYADGVALLEVLLSLADGAGGRAGPATPPDTSAAGLRAPPDTAASARLLPDLLPSSLTRVVREGADALEKGVHYALHPGEGATAAQQALGLVAELVRLAALPDDPPTRLKQPLSGIRRCAWAAPLLLEEVRTVGRLLGCTVNDVLVATLAGALGRYLSATGDAVTGTTIHAAVPVNLRSAEGGAHALGNQFGMVFVPVPIGITHPLERLYAVHASMQQLKASTQALATLALLHVVGNLPSVVEQPTVEMFTAKASLVASNLPGPRTPLRICGSAVTQVLFWVPQGGSIGTGISMLSYAGRVQFGVMADRQVIPDPHQLVELIDGEFERLVYLVLLGARSL